MRMICEKRSLSSIELRIELRTKPSDEKFGSLSAITFEEYEAPRMNPSVVAATRGLDFSKRVDHSSPQGGSLPKSLTEPLLSSQGRRRTHREGGRVPRPDAPTRPPDSIESKQRKLNSRADGRVDLEEPQFENPGFEYDQHLPGLPQSRWNPYNSSSSQLHQGQGATHTSRMKKRSRKLDRVSRVRWSAPDGRLPLQTTTLLPVLWGALRYPNTNPCLLEHLEHMGREEQGRTWCMDAAQLDTQRKKEEAILKSARPAKLQLDRAESQQSNPKNVASPLTSL
ncbi:unnamed protein product [Microthlaspi erraticum]|uniref:Uncharacterized protein n=1 Tax=Microthlaspi erraticum TaxID=1685480 RepID=A0A6D2JIH4_9BRAS|nr:unnamed protein product [Microthlaspi erraticum]